MSEYYPAWLGDSLVQGDLPWDDFIPCRLPRFLEQYTLHDSYWISLLSQPTGETMAVVRWDTYWTQGRVSFPGSLVADWPILLIRFINAYEVHNNNQGQMDTIAGSVSGVLSLTERQDLLKNSLNNRPGSTDFVDFLRDKIVYKTLISAIDGGCVQILHGDNTAFLCLSRDKTVLPLPGLSEG